IPSPWPSPCGRGKPCDASRYLYWFPPTEEGTLGCTAVLVRVPSYGRGNLGMHRGTCTGSFLREREPCDAPRYSYGFPPAGEGILRCTAILVRFPRPAGEGSLRCTVVPVRVPSPAGRGPG